MPLEIVRDDITRIKVDAIVNPTDLLYSGSGGVDKAIHQAAGNMLKMECGKLKPLAVGEVKLTRGYDLPADFVIHTIGPVWEDGSHSEEQLLERCYMNALNLALENGLDSIAFPLIATGTFGFPKDRALRIATSTISEFLLNHDLMVYLVVYDKKSYQLSKRLFTAILEYIDDNYIEDEPRLLQSSRAIEYLKNEEELDLFDIKEEARYSERKARSLEDLVDHLDDTFSQMLLRLIDEKGMTDVDTYKRANVDRKLFSKIRNDDDYQPNKRTALAFAIALELNLDETKDLLLSAGYALSRSNMFDVIIEYFIEKQNYNIFEINEALFEFDQKILGH